jgi:hypothetical protein
MDTDCYKHYIEMLKYHEANRTSTDDRNKYWKNTMLALKLDPGFKYTHDHGRIQMGQPTALASKRSSHP